MLYSLLFLSLTGWGLAGARIVGNAYYGPLWAQCALAVLVYTFALLGFLHPAAVVLASAGILYGLYAALRHDWKQKEFRLVLAISALAFALALSNSAGMRFFAWDEFSHWGLQLKYLATTNHLQTDGLDLIFPDYIPGLSLYRYLGSVFGLPLESGASLLNWYLAYLCIAALATGTTAEGRTSGWLTVAAILAMGFAGYFFFFQGLVATMYVDPLQSLLLLACFVLAPQIKNSPQPFLSFAPLLILVVLTKHVGIVFAGMAIGLYLVMSYVEESRLQARDLKLCGAWAAGCLLYFASWKLYVMFHDLLPAYRLAVEKLPGADGGVFTFLSNNIQAVLQGSFPHSQLFGTPAVKVDHGVRFLWHAMAGAGILVLAVLAMAGRPLRGGAGIVLGYLLLCLCAYLVFLSVVRGLSGWQTDVWSFSRYFSALLFPCSFFTIIYFLRKTASRRIAWSASAATLAAMTIVTPGAKELFHLGARQAPAMRLAPDELAKELNGKVPSGSTAWHIYDADDGLKYFVNRYTLYPIRLLNIKQSWRFFSKDALRHPVSEANSPLAFAETLKQVDYVIADRPNPEFWTRYGRFFPDRDHRVYRVVPAQDGGVLLQGI